MSRRPARPAPARGVPPGPGRARPVRTRGRAVLGLALLALTVTACGLRLETPPPPPPVPDAAETLRQATVADAVHLQELAAATEHPDPAVQLLVDTVREAAAEHVDALGGVYDPGTADGAAAPTAGASAPSPAAAPTSTEPAPSGGAGSPAGDDDAPSAEAPDDAVGRLATTLAEASANAHAAADEAEDGPMARLLGAVAANRLLLGERLAAAVDGGTAPERPAPWTVDLGATLPPDVPGSAALPLVTAEDLTAQAWEVVAARRDGAARASAAARAALHRARSQAWAEAADVAGSGLDPRRPSYALPAGVLSGEPAAAADDLAMLEGRLAAAYASLVAQAAPGARGPLVAASADAAGAAAGLTGDVPAFPGMPERDS